MQHDGDPTTDDARDAFTGWLTLVPALALALPVPFALLRGVPTTVSAGTGWTALLALPAALVVVLTRRQVRPRGAALLLVVLAVAALGAGGALDPFAARRSFTALAAGATLLVCGASLGPAGRRVLARGLALCSLVWLAWAAVDRGARFTGALGNTGDLSEAVLPGAVAGLAVFATTAGPLRAAGLAAGVGATLYAGLVPVLAGLLALVTAGLFALVASWRSPAGARTARIVLLVGLAGTVVFAGRTWLGGNGDAESQTATISDPTFGGAEFRRRTWVRVPELLAGRTLLGVGPGQFEREFPPFRDPTERRLSSHGGREPTPVEVEHAHSDWIQGVAELGLVGGSAWIALLLLVLARSWAAVASGDPTRVGLGAAAVAVLANAAVNSPLLYGPAAPAVAWPLFGAVLGSREGGGAALRRTALLVPVFVTLLLASRSVGAWQLTRHGAALAALARARVVSPDGAEGLLAAGAAPYIADALRACPDSVVALEKRGELLVAIGAPVEERVATLERILAARPHRFGALLNLGVVHAQAGEHRDAKSAFARASALAPEDATLLKNRLLLAIEVDDRDVLLELVSQLMASDEIEADWVERTAAAQLLSGRPGIAGALLRIVDSSFDVARAETSFELAKRLESEGRDLLADGALANAHFLWAREHVAAGVFETAVRSYRQSLRISREYEDLPGGAVLVKLELAAAQGLAERVEDARATLEGVEIGAVEMKAVPVWAGQALMDVGLLR